MLVDKKKDGIKERMKDKKMFEEPSLFHVLFFCSDSGGKCNFLMGLSNTRDTGKTIKTGSRPSKYCTGRSFPSSYAELATLKETVIPLQKVRGRPSCARSPANANHSAGYWWRVPPDLSSY